MPKIEVCKGEKLYFLRIHFNAGRGGIIRMETSEEFTKREADGRAILLAIEYSWDRDELPTHDKIAAYPKTV